MRSRRVFSIAACVVAMLAATTACSSSSKGSSAASSGRGSGDSVGGSSAHQSLQPFTLGGFLAPVPILAGIKQGAFSNLSMKFTSLDSGPAGLPLIQRGTLAGIDNVSATPILIAAARGISLKIVWIDNATSLELLAKPNITSAAQLKGKTVAVITGSVLQLKLDNYLAAHGMTESDVHLVNLAPASMPAAFKTGQVDAAYIWPPQSATIAGYGAKILDKQSDEGYLVMSSSFVSKYPATVQRLVCDMYKTHQRLQAEPSSAYSAIGAKIGQPASVIASLLPATNVAPANQATADWLGTGSTPSRFAQVITDSGQFLVDQKVVTKATDLASVQAMFDPSFAANASAGKC